MKERRIEGKPGGQPDSAPSAITAEPNEERTLAIEHVINRRIFETSLDLILVVEAGRVVERGTHATLLAAGGRYAELYETQFEHDTRTPAEPVR